MPHAHVMEYHSARRGLSEPTLFYLDRSRRYLNEASQSPGTTQCIMLLTHVQNGTTQRRADRLLPAVSGREDWQTTGEKSWVIQRLDKGVGVISRPNERAKD